MIVHIPSDYVLMSENVDARTNARITRTVKFAHPDLLELREKKRLFDLTDAEIERYERLREAQIDIQLDDALFGSLIKAHT